MGKTNDAPGGIPFWPEEDRHTRFMRAVAEYYACVESYKESIYIILGERFGRVPPELKARVDRPQHPDPGVVSPRLGAPRSVNDLDADQFAVRAQRDGHHRLQGRELARDLAGGRLRGVAARVLDMDEATLGRQSEGQTAVGGEGQ